MDLFNMENQGNSFLDKKGVNQNDGIYRPKQSIAKDKKKGYLSTIRFLPNLKKDETWGDNAIEKAIHYFNMSEYPELKGYYDALSSFKDEKCELSLLFFKFKKSTSVLEQEKTKILSRSTKWYSYIQIIEDENQPELVGKIMVFPFGHKIKEKIAQEHTGELTGTPCNVFDLAAGKDFKLLVKGEGDRTDYTNSKFRDDPSSIHIFTKDGKFVNVPTTPNEETGKATIDAKFHPKIKEMLLTREFELESFSAKKYTPEQAANVKQIVSVLTNSPIAKANESIKSAAKVDDGGFFDDDDDVVGTTTTATQSKGKAAKVEDEDDFFNV